MTKSKKIGTVEFISVFFRSFFLQSVWNYQSLLSIGFAYALMPVMNKIFSTRQEKKEFLRRHLNFFNAHPYFASFALGAVSRIEEDHHFYGGDQNQAERLKNALIGPLGALGDQMFWGTIKPAVILLGVIAVLVTENVYTFLYLYLFLLILYNIPHLYIRYYGLVEGYRQGLQVYKLLNIKRYQNYQKLYYSIGALSIGFIIGYSFFDYESQNVFLAVAFILSVAIAYYFHKIKRSFFRNVGFTLLLSLVYGIIVENL